MYDSDQTWMLRFSIHGRGWANPITRIHDVGFIPSFLTLSRRPVTSTKISMQTQEILFGEYPGISSNLPPLGRQRWKKTNNNSTETNEVRQTDDRPPIN